MGSRCSVSAIRGGLCTATLCGWPEKSVAVTNRSSGWPGGSSGASGWLSAITSSASASRREKPMPPKGGANQRERTSRDSLARTSARAAGDTLAVTILPRRPSSSATSGTAQYFMKRVTSRASGSSSTSTSARSSHSFVSGSSDWPEWMACARKMPLIPPALAPAIMSGSTRRRRPCCISMVRSKSSHTASLGWDKVAVVSASSGMTAES